jgi:hypothetical protein
LRQISQQQFDGLTLEERDAFLERRDAEERKRALSAANVGKGEIFLRYAAELVRQERSLFLNIAKLAAKVAERCREAGITNPRGGEPYSAKTAYNHLTGENRLRLLDALVGEIPGSIESFPQRTSNDRHGAGKVSS